MKRKPMDELAKRALSGDTYVPTLNSLAERIWYELHKSEQMVMTIERRDNGQAISKLVIVTDDPKLAEELHRVYRTWDFPDSEIPQNEA